MGQKSFAETVCICAKRNSGRRQLTRRGACWRLVSPHSAESSRPDTHALSFWRFMKDVYIPHTPVDLQELRDRLLTLQLWQMALSSANCGTYYNIAWMCVA
jgi:hypothetical protein